MSILLDYQKLFKPYTDRYASLENTLRYLEKTARSFGIPSEIMVSAIHQIFMEVANGRRFHINYCPCGCGIDKPPTAITHAMRDRMFELDRTSRIESIKIINRDLDKLVIKHISRQNRAYLRKYAASEEQEAPKLSIRERFNNFLAKKRSLRRKK